MTQDQLEFIMWLTGDDEATVMELYDKWNRLKTTTKMDLFDNNSGAEFSRDRKYRYALWLIWDTSLPYVMFVGLNPSTANETDNDPTIKSCCRIAKANGYGGIYMMNCWAYISTNPDELIGLDTDKINDEWLVNIGRRDVTEIVFAWGNFKIVTETGRDKELKEMFPNAKVLATNKNGSPKHPLYCKSNTQFQEQENQIEPPKQQGK